MAEWGSDQRAVVCVLSLSVAVPCALRACGDMRAACGRSSETAGAHRAYGVGCRKSDTTHGTQNATHEYMDICL